MTSRRSIKQLSKLGRVIKGERYPAYSNWAPDDTVSEYRRHGVRCRRWQDVLYIHEDDFSMARLIDSTARPAVATHPIAHLTIAQGEVNP